MRARRDAIFQPGPQEVVQGDPELMADIALSDSPPLPCTVDEEAELRVGEAKPGERREPGGLPRDFRAAFDTLTLGACGVDETQEVFAPIVKPLQEALEREAGGEDSPSVKMIASLAAQSYADFSYHLGQLRQTGDRLLQGPALKQREQLQRWVERCFAQSIQALELLRRPDTSRVSVRVGSASNLNLGVQQVELSGQGQGAQVGRQRRQGRTRSPK